MSSQTRKARYLSSPECSNSEDNAINKENNHFIDSIFQNRKPEYVEKLVSFNSLGSSSIKISKFVPAQTDVSKSTRSKRPLANKKNQLATDPKLSICDIFNEDEMSDHDLFQLVNKGKRKRSGRKKPAKMSKHEREAKKIRQEEEALLPEAMREYNEIKNYKLIVETVQKDY